MPGAPAHELASPVLRPACGPLGLAGAAGDLVAAASYPAQAAAGGVSAAAHPRSRAEARGDTLQKPMVVDAVAPRHGGSGNPGAGRADLEPARARGDPRQ